ncbi:MAG TPA: hypothetical protein VHD36_12095 [Pirellulales bacterium]|nr:hypothetical protein [Pirellulales bacterium]
MDAASIRSLIEAERAAREAAKKAREPYFRWRAEFSAWDLKRRDLRLRSTPKESAAWIISFVMSCRATEVLAAKLRDVPDTGGLTSTPLSRLKSLAESKMSDGNRAVAVAARIFLAAIDGKRKALRESLEAVHAAGEAIFVGVSEAMEWLVFRSSCAPKKSVQCKPISHAAISAAQPQTWLTKPTVQERNDWLKEQHARLHSPNEVLQLWRRTYPGFWPRLSLASVKHAIYAKPKKRSRTKVTA